MEFPFDLACHLFYAFAMEVAGDNFSFDSAQINQTLIQFWIWLMWNLCVLKKDKWKRANWSLAMDIIDSMNGCGEETFEVTPIWFDQLESFPLWTTDILAWLEQHINASHSSAKLQWFIILHVRKSVLPNSLNECVLNVRPDNWSHRYCEGKCLRTSTDILFCGPFRLSSIFRLLDSQMLSDGWWRGESKHFIYRFIENHWFL